MKRKNNTYYSNVILKKTDEEKRQLAIVNWKRLSDEKYYMKAKFDAMYHRHSSKKKENLPKFKENSIVNRISMTSRNSQNLIRMRQIIHVFL